MPVRPLRHFLDLCDVPYRAYNHPPTFTAQETAHELHISGYEVAKTVILKVDGRFVMAVLAACEQIDLNRFRSQVDATLVELATEKDMELLAPYCDKGSIPPIGNLFGLPVYVSTTLTKDEIIAFNAGNHTEDIRMFYRDFEALVQPRIMDFSYVH